MCISYVVGAHFCGLDLDMRSQYHLDMPTQSLSVCAEAMRFSPAHPAEDKQS